MPIEIQYNSNPKGVIVVLSGTVGGQEIIAANAEVAQALDASFQLWDFSAVADLEISPEEMHKIAAQDGSIPEQAKLTKIAVVGPRKVFHGLDEVYHVYSGSWIGRRKAFESKSFESLDEAWKWLGA